ncbi:ABC transporter ATP-binding protein [Aureimonas frigidaquae]|uniref:ABC transporter ATP-binding protein n=1 Tax=Aureimonas frigidaquae TaxID=424757 RepID=UPI00078027EF|nr:ABC transporter ATP-binding protein [Aureimonas frigidaquae]
MAKLILNHVTKRFEGTAQPAVDDLSLELPERAFMALLGPSGCGKTTVLRMVAGFEQPTGGDIRLGERRLADAGGMVPPEHRGMAMVFQSYALWPHMSVADNAGYPLKVRGVGRDAYDRKVRAALAAVRLDAMADRRPAELSGGQRQRVALARCLVTDPSVVLLDEPLANLDRHLRQEMEENFRIFHERSGAAMIYVTHDQSEAMALASHVAVMAEGRLLQVAAPQALYARPQGRLVGELVGRGRILDLAEDGDPARHWPRERIAAALVRRGHGGALRAVLVRPEHVVADAPGMPATVAGCIFEGERYLLRLTLEGGGELLAYATSPHGVGSSIGVAILEGWCLGAGDAG